MIGRLPKNECCGCLACEQICPRNCITSETDVEGFCYPKVESSKCINCNLCEKVCPSTEEESQKNIDVIAFAARTTDKSVQTASSSGGVFMVAAREILNHGGMVYGAAFDTNYSKVKHIRVDNIQELHRIQGSKYVQSDTSGIFVSVKNDLLAGGKVLFSGVPCQVSALKRFLNKDYLNLICIEVICHGVPSPLVWKKYLEQRGFGTISFANFRDKTNGWENFGIRICSDTQDSYIPKSEDSYLKFFLSNYSLRPSCYQCKVKKQQSKADLTIGDFWGIDKIIPSFYDSNGVSLVLVQTKNGEQLFSLIKGNLDYVSVNCAEAIKENSAYNESVNAPEGRQRFFKLTQKRTLSQMSKDFFNPTIMRRIINRLKREFRISE